MAAPIDPCGISGYTVHTQAERMDRFYAEWRAADLDGIPPRLVDPPRPMPDLSHNWNKDEARSKGRRKAPRG